jgi:hypothetical protein
MIFKHIGIPYEINSPIEAIDATAVSTVTEPKEGKVKRKETVEQRMVARVGDMDFSSTLLKK